MTDINKLREELRERDSAWQADCDEWEAEIKKRGPRRKWSAIFATMRTTLYGRAAEALTAQEGRIAELEAAWLEAETRFEALAEQTKGDWAKHGGTEIALGQWKFRAEAAEARLAAIRAEALEESAKVADRFADQNREQARKQHSRAAKIARMGGDPFGHGEMAAAAGDELRSCANEADALAAAIRALGGEHG